MWRSQASIHEERRRYCKISAKPDAARNLPSNRSLSYFRGKKILLWTRKPGLGDMVMNAMCCDILRRQHGLDVWYGCRHNPHDRDFPKILKGIPCYRYQPDLREHPLPEQPVPRGYEGGVDHQGGRHPFDFILDFRYHMHRQVNTLFQCLEEFGVGQMRVPYQGLPVRGLPAAARPYDVVLCTNCGGWKPVRAYRRGDELAELLRQRGYTVLNLSEGGVQKRLRLADLLAQVKAAKLYIGVETGPTHLVSGVHRKALILQSGIHPSAFWNVYDRTFVIEKSWNCGGRKCRVRRHEECVMEEGVCMDRLAPADIADVADQLIRQP
ncbi:MAG TPA: hypothetical protein DIT64_11680 [Verrucomicrobiales bacterium]|nr:hypothetical protein [Verrucomicrobiales bacterium]